MTGPNQRLLCCILERRHLHVTPLKGEYCVLRVLVLVPSPRRFVGLYPY